MVRVAINGYGRIGRVAHRVILERYVDQVEIVAINAGSSTDIKGWMYLLKYDTSYGPIYSMDVSYKEKGGREKIKIEAEDLKKELAISVNEVKEYRATLSDELQLLLDFTQVCMHLRDIRKEPLQKVITLMSNCGRAIFKKIGLDEEDAAYAYYEDFVSGSYARAEYKAEIAKRKDGVTVLFSNEEIIFEYGDVAEKKAQALDLFDKITTSNELRGSTAYPGKVRGIVRVLHNEDDFSPFNEGEILVTSMTRPEFVPLMKRAAAVITDEGGVTCHAAIIARELKLPCIIGTRQATRVLRDGDLVELDAEKGIVRRIDSI
jgi:phosphoenolpyruvate synthase/pyruvate phosphate dikinase